MVPEPEFRPACRDLATTGEDDVFIRFLSTFGYGASVSRLPAVAALDFLMFWAEAALWSGNHYNWLLCDIILKLLN